MLYFKSIALASAALGLALSNATATTLPDCDQSDVLHKVYRAISIHDKNIIQSGNPVISIKHMRQTRSEENGPRTTAQRYCRAKGYDGNGRGKTIYYLIEANAGFAGYGYNVEACIAGRDPWKIHGAYCNSVR